MSKRKAGLRSAFLDGRTVACCALCNDTGDARLFDVDHKIALRFGGPNLPWNLWTLCLKHHRLKSLWEMKLASFVNGESFCWSCASVQSKYFMHGLFCAACANNFEAVDANLKRWIYEE